MSDVFFRINYGNFPADVGFFPDIGFVWTGLTVGTRFVCRRQRLQRESTFFPTIFPRILSERRTHPMVNC